MDDFKICPDITQRRGRSDPMIDPTKPNERHDVTRRDPGGPSGLRGRRLGMSVALWISVATLPWAGAYRTAGAQDGSAAAASEANPCDVGVLLADLCAHPDPTSLIQDADCDGVVELYNQDGTLK